MGAVASRTSPPGTDSSPVVDIEDFVVESSVGWRNGSGQASPPVQYRQRDVGGISGGEGVDGPGGGGRSSFEVSVPQQRGDEQNERGHLSLPYCRPQKTRFSILFSIFYFCFALAAHAPASLVAPLRTSSTPVLLGSSATSHRAVLAISAKHQHRRTARVASVPFISCRSV